MVLQSFLFPNEVCRTPELYYRVRGTYKEETNRIVLDSQAEFSSDTYMNLIDIDSWKKYTDMKEVQLFVTVSGIGKVILMEMRREGDKKIEEICFHTQEPVQYCFLIKDTDLHGNLYICLIAEEEAIFYGAYCSNREKEKREVKISLVICTYKREKQLMRNIEKLSSSDFFRENSERNGKLCIRVVDNASELKELKGLKGDNRYLYKNKNTGGSGGFTRGILESQKDLKRFPATHILLMDDDVELLPETFYRLYALLSFIKEEYLSEVIAGRMFYLDKRTVQYTASDIWNGGLIRHVGYRQDMSLKENLYEMNIEKGEYSGWWFACFPMAFTIENLPIPFFLHCDDVEYGLRHGGEPIVLNGIQVWHETCEYRQSAVIYYYDIRNSAYTNTIIHYPRIKFHLMKSWFLGLLSNIRRRKWNWEYMKLLAIRDYCKGKEWLYQIDSEENHKRICREAEKKVHIIPILIWEIEAWIRVLYKK